jgi:hypothetical protein
MIRQPPLLLHVCSASSVTCCLCVLACFNGFVSEKGCDLVLNFGQYDDAPWVKVDDLGGVATVTGVHTKVVVSLPFVLCLVTQPN